MSGVLQLLLANRDYPGVVTLNDDIITDQVLDPADASAGVVIDSDGNVYSVTTTAGTVQLFTTTDWVRPTNVAPGSFQVRATLNSGTLSGGTTGSWLALTSDRSWSVARTEPGTSSAGITVEIRWNEGIVLASATYGLTAEIL